MSRGHSSTVRTCEIHIVVIVADVRKTSVCNLYPNMYRNHNDLDDAWYVVQFSLSFWLDLNQNDYSRFRCWYAIKRSRSLLTCTTISAEKFLKEAQIVTKISWRANDQAKQGPEKKEWSHKAILQRLMSILISFHQFSKNTFTILKRMMLRATRDFHLLSYLLWA